MKHSFVLLGVLAGSVLLVGAGCAGQTTVRTQTTERPAAVAALSVPPAANAPDQASAREITAAEVAKHKTPDDCWLAINGIVYDVSGYATKHPGREAVYAGCGRDATVLFETRPMGSGTPHSDKARAYMKNYEIGTYKP
ncbi:MAG: cytochrome b5-like heme/steroid binding domain-containing protein [Patescibacteria group bacterium]|jgi:cytochrome b involved in lipid metabolism